MNKLKSNLNSLAWYRHKVEHFNYMYRFADSPHPLVPLDIIRNSKGISLSEFWVEISNHLNHWDEDLPLIVYEYSSKWKNLNWYAFDVKLKKTNGTVHASKYGSFWQYETLHLRTLGGWDYTHQTKDGLTCDCKRCRDWITLMFSCCPKSAIESNLRYIL